MFNLSIMAATAVGGLLLTHSPGSGVNAIVYMSLILFILATARAVLTRRSLRSP